MMRAVIAAALAIAMVAGGAGRKKEIPVVKQDWEYWQEASWEPVVYQEPSAFDEPMIYVGDDGCDIDMGGMAEWN